MRLLNLLSRPAPARADRTEPVLEIDTRASLENPAVALDDPAALERLFGGYTSSAGLTVTPESVLGIPAALAAVRLIAETLGAAPLHIYRRGDNGRREIAVDHPLYRTLAASPNPRSTAMTFRTAITAHAIVFGNGFAWIERNNAGRPTGNLWPLDPRHTEIKIAEDTGELVFEHRAGARRWLLRSADVLHIPGFGLDTARGGDPLVWLLRNLFGTALAALDFGGRFYRNGATPSLIFTTPAEMPTEAVQQFRAHVDSSAAGLANAFRYMVAPKGVGVEVPSGSLRDAQHIETMNHLVREIARVFNVPAPMIGDLERATFSNIEHQGLDFVRKTIWPWRERWRQEIDRKLLAPTGRSASLFESGFVLDHLTEGDFKTRMDGYSIAAQNGIMTRNEIRRELGLADLPGLDDPLTPVNTAGTVPAAPTDAGAAPAADQESSDAAD